MTKHVLMWLTCLGLACLTATSVFGQTRYENQIFSDATVTSNVVYAQNISILTGTPDTIPLVCDVYQPDGDTVSNRPVLLLAGTGNFLPPLFNGSPVGSIRDSAQVELAMNMAKRGYVVISFYYRQGWDAANPDVTTQTRTLLQATYRGIQDARTCARWIRRSAIENTNPYRINPEFVGIIGMGTGGYVAYAATFLNDFNAELNLIKFQDPMTGNVLVDQSVQGNLEGTDTTFLNVANHVGFRSDFQLCVNIGGALGDSSWINPGEAPTISFHCNEDDNAPYELGNVIVPTTNNVVIPEAAGSFLVSRIQDRLGNNDVFKSLNLSDPYTVRANAVNNGWEGFYPFILPDTGGTYDCFGTPLPLDPQGSPWTWWDEAGFIASWDAAGLDTVFGASGVVANCGQRRSNPDMSATKGRTYVDTMASYMAPRINAQFQAVITGSSVEDIAAANIGLYPNPARTEITIQNADTGNPIKEIAIMDQQGRVIYRRNPGQSNTVRIQRQNWASGLYIVRIETRKGVLSKKLLLD